MNAATSTAPCLDGRGWDGIAVTPVTPSRLSAAIQATGLEAEHKLGVFPNGTVLTVRALAETAIAAGCRPSYMRVLVPALDTLLAPDFPIQLLTDSKAGYFPLLVVNGPIRAELEINGRANVLGPGFRANSTIGRAVNLVISRFGIGSAPRSSTLGTAYGHTCVIGEDEEHSPWAPLNKDLGWTGADSTVTVLVASQPRYVSQQGTAEPAAILRAFAEELSSATAFNPLDVDVETSPNAFLIIGEDHRGYLTKAGWDRAAIQAELHAAAQRRAGVIRAAGYRTDARLQGIADDERVPVFSGPDAFRIVSAGSGGGRSMIGATLFGRVAAALAETLVSPVDAAKASSGESDEAYADTVDQYIDKLLTDGWPVVVPQPETVEELILASGRGGADQLGRAPWREAPITVRDAAINACMAGCLPQHMPLLVAMYEFMFSPLHDQGVAGMAPSTGGYNVWFVVHGPIAKEAGLNSGSALFGPGHHSNVALGRAIRLGLMNLAGLKPNLADRSCLGQAYKYGTVIAENEGLGAWGPLHSSLGFTSDQSAITMGWGSHPRLTLNDSAETPEELLRSLAENMSTVQGFDSPAMVAPGETELTEAHLKWRERITGRWPLLVMSPRHQALLRDAGITREQAQEILQGLSARRVGDARAAGYGTSPLIDPGQSDDAVIHLHRQERVLMMCAGGDGGATMVNQFTYLATREYYAGRIVEPAPAGS